MNHVPPFAVIFFRFKREFLKKLKTKRPGRLLSALVIMACYFPMAHASEEGPKTLTIKGLYMGMPLERAVKTAAAMTDTTHYGLQSFNLSEYKFRKFESTAHRHWYCDLRKSVTSPVVFATDAEKRLTFLSIQGTLVERLFESNEETAEDFARNFAAAHGLPMMTPFQQAHQSPLPNILPDSGWRFLSPFGYKITVYSNKDIDLEKTGP